MKKNVSLLVIIMLVYLLQACGSNGWIYKYPVFSDSGIYFENINDAELNITDRLTEFLNYTPFTQLADSIGIHTLILMANSYNKSGFTKSHIVDDKLDADYILRVENITIRWKPTLNFVQPGPYFKVSITATASIGNDIVFRTTKSANANLSFIAGNGKKFHFPTAEEKRDPQIQQETILPALRNAYGQVWEEFLRANKRTFH